MKKDLIKRYAHTWRVFEQVVKDFEPGAWLRTGRKATTPARLSFHMLKAVKDYLEDTSTLIFESGKPFDNHPAKTPEADLPSQSDVVACIGVMQAKTEQWLDEMDLNAPNTSFSWAGETRFGVALFNLHHFVFHLGELSSLLNESRGGVAEDNYVKAL